MEIYRSTWTPFTISEAKEKISREVDTNIFETCIKAIIKNEFNLLYVHLKSRTNSIDTTKVILSRNLFDINFLQAIYEHTLVINID